MKSVQIDLINPRAMKLLEELAQMNIISIRTTPKISLAEILKDLRSDSEEAPSLEEITAEVEAVRAARYARQK